MIVLNNSICQVKPVVPHSFTKLICTFNKCRLSHVLLIIFLLSGCTKVGPDFHKPDVVVSSNWIDSGDSRVRSEPADYRNWWRVFNDPVLDRLVDRAYRENLSLRIAGVRVLEARAQLGIAIEGLYPQTQQASGSVQYNRISEAARGPAPASESLSSPK